MENFTPLSALAGGALIGLGTSLLLLLNGRLAGVSGVLGGLIAFRRSDADWRVLFLVGLVIGAGAWIAFKGVPTTTYDVGLPLIIAGGLLTGIGTGIGAGCTSGHGVCGIARLSPRSVVAAATFIATGMATVFVLRHLIGL